MHTLISFVWTANPEIFEVFGISIVWYGLLFAMGFVVGQQIMFYIYKKEGLETRYVEELTMFMIVATVLGARLGHVFFYEPMRYLSDPIQILNIRGGGLASHGAGIGIFIGIYLYMNYTIKIGLIPPKFSVQKIKKVGQTWLFLADRIVIIVALCGALIRFGNFINSEIIGKPTNSDYGVVFARDTKDYLEKSEKAIEQVTIYKNSNATNEHKGYSPLTLEVQLVKGDYAEESVNAYFEKNFKRILSNSPYINEHIVLLDDQYEFDYYQKNGQYHAKVAAWGINRHPAQLYESISCVILLIILLAIWNKKRANLQHGTLFGIFLVYIFGLRFFYEFLKENQVAFEDTLLLNMGQWLSIPMVIAGAVVLLRALKTKEIKE